MRWLMASSLVASSLAIFLLSASAMANTDFPARILPTTFAELPGWAHDDHEAALVAFARTCVAARARAPRSRMSGVDGTALASICEDLQQNPPSSARAFFEAHFTAHSIESSGLLTGYFEPQVTASFTRTEQYRYPIYSRPADLMELPGPPGNYGLSEDVTWGRRVASGYQAFPDRQAIMNGALDGEGLELAYLADPVDLFFIHIQGSARLSMTDGSVQRINFAGKSGHVYTPIGRTLVQQGLMELENVTMDSLRDWLQAANPEDRQSVLATNRSYIFFVMTEDDAPDAGPTAAAGVPLTPGRSLAVDRHLHTFGTPIFVTSEDALPEMDQPFNRLMIAQDTGSAIVGPARGDIFIGSGEHAGRIAGQVNQPISFTILMPKVR